jgi:hypothetical protein
VNFIFIVIMVCCVAGFIVFYYPTKKETISRPDFLEKLRQFMEGRLDPIPESPNAFRITFTFQKRPFVYEDIFMPGFKGMVNKGYLKLQTNSMFTMTLSEKKEKKLIQPDIVMMSNVTEIEDPVTRNVSIPEALKEFRVHASDSDKATRIFRDGKIAKIFVEFKNMDTRGYPISAVRIVDGQLILEFNPSARFNPNLIALYRDVAVIEDFANKLILLADKIERG